LVPAWPKDLDDTLNSYSKLKLDSDFARDTEHGHRVFREWVLNENGDYNEMRGIKRWDTSESFADFENLFFFTHVRRRKFLPTLSQLGDDTLFGIHGGVLVEFSLDDGENWYPITGGERIDGTTSLYRGLSYPSIRILQKEAGIRFTGTYPPRELLKLNGGEPAAKLRVTACLEGDVPIEHQLNTKSHLNVSDAKTRIVDVSSRMRYDVIDDKSEGKDQPKSREVDNRGDIQEIAIELGENWGHASMNGPVQIFGSNNVFLPIEGGGTVNVAESLGYDVKSISGRNLEFGLNTDESKHPTIEAVIQDLENHSTRLEFKTFRRPVA